MSGPANERYTTYCTQTNGSKGTTANYKVNPWACRFPSKLEGLVVVCLGTIITKILIFNNYLDVKSIDADDTNGLLFVYILVYMNHDVLAQLQNITGTRCW
mgnify:CR=1 FL=1